MTGDMDFKGKSAVVLDDNPQMRAILRSVLNSMGIRSVTEFSDPSQLLHYLQGHHIDVAVVDLVLNSHMDGLELSNVIRHDPRVVNATMPIILVTGYPSMSVIEQAINIGVDELVTKPLRARDLMVRVNKVLSRPRPYIRTPSGYFGPDRRRRNDPVYTGPERREADMADVIKTDKDARRAIARLKPDALIEQRSIDEAVILLD
jgi:CheY-like chemotaxis protein